MSMSDLIALVCATALLAACAQTEPIYQQPYRLSYPATGQYPYPTYRSPQQYTQQYPQYPQQYGYPAQRQDTIRDTSQQLSSLQQIIQQLQNLQRTISGF